MTGGATRSGGPGKSGEIVEFDSALWRQLLNRGEKDAFFQSWLALQARQLPGVIGGVLVALEPDGQLRPVAYWPKGASPGLELMRTIQSAVRRKMGVVRRIDPAPGEGQPISAFAYPILLDEDVVAVAGFNVTGSIEDELQAALRRVQWGAVWVENLFREERSLLVEDTGNRLAATLDLIAVSLDHEEAEAAAIALMTETATRLGLERASIGFLRGGGARVAAISHTSEVSRRQNLVRAIADAMDEAIDQGMILAYPTGEGEHAVTRAQRALSQRLGAGGPVVTVPLEEGGKTFGAVTLEYRVETELSKADIDTAHAFAALAGRVLRLRRREERLLVTKAGEVARRQAGRLIGPDHVGRKIFLGVVAALVVFFSVYESAFTLPARATLEGEVQRVISAPYDGYVAEEHARPGDVVEAGAVLARLDDRELSLQLAAWQSRRAQYEAERQSALAERDIARARVFEAQVEEAAVQVDLVERQLALATITAPFDGLVLTGDLSQGLGSAVRLGDPLFQIAPLDGYRVVLQIDEEDIHELRIGQTGGLILAARPETVLPFAVTKITSVTEPVDGRNTFRVEARLDQTPESLRPGMQGIAKVDAGERLLIWIWTRRALNWLRLQLWKWLP